MSGPGDVIAGLAPPQDNGRSYLDLRGRPRRGDESREPAEHAGEGDGASGDGDTGSGADGLAEAPAEALNALAGYIRSSWARNKRARDVVEHRLLACLRARRGVYAEAELAEMWTADAGEPLYLPLAASKMRAAESALRELLLPEGERPWGIDPSPIPELPPELARALVEQAAQMARQQMVQIAANTGKVVSLDQFQAMAAQLQGRLRDQALEAAQAEAKLRAGRMEDVLEERMERGGYYKAMAEFIQHFSTYPAAVLKGPFLRRGKRLRWRGVGEPEVQAQAEPAWTAVNPFDCYPAPEAESCQDGDFIERIRMTRADLYECIGCPGYDEAAIRRVLEQHQSGGLWSDAQRRMLEGETHDVWIPDYLVDALHFWGSVEGRVLLDHGLTEGVGDPLAYYEVDAVLIGSEVVRCEVNDDPLGRRPYHNASFDPVPGAFWGNAIHDLMRDCQAMVNACARALNANLGLASGPMMGIDMSQLAVGQDPKAMRPLQVIQLDRSRAQSAAAPIEWYQADSRAPELLAIIEKFEQKADDLTGIPRYMSGVQDASGAAETASGLSLLMSTAAKGLRRAVASIDRNVIGRTVEAAYVHEMLYNPDPSIKGDCTVNARGAAALLVKEHLQQTRTQFLQMTANPIDMQIIGVQGRRAILAEVAKTLEMPVEEIVPDEQALAARQQALQGATAAPPAPTPNAQLKAQTERDRMASQERIAGARIAGHLAGKFRTEGMKHGDAAAEAGAVPGVGEPAAAA